MPIATTVLFGSPRCEIATILNRKLETSIATQIVVGFATLNGMEAIEPAIRKNPGSLQAFIVGAGTHKAFDAFDRLLGFGVRADALRVHLGHARSGNRKVRNGFRPMLHSKIFYTENADGSASAIIGSHNATGFALLGLNGEAAVLIEGNRNSLEFEKIRSHIATAKSEAVQYSYSSRPALSGWTQQFLAGLAMRANEVPSGIKNDKTFVILCEHASGSPVVDEILYVELPIDLGRVNSLRADFHLYVFGKLPRSPMEGLSLLDSAQGFDCEIVGVDVERGTREVNTDWVFTDPLRPALESTGGLLRPTPKAGMQQVRVRLRSSLRKRYEYLFDRPGTEWEPVQDNAKAVGVPQDYSKEGQESPGKTNSAHKSWFLVKGLRPKEPARDDKLSIAVKKMSPEEGTFVMMSLRRKTNGLLPVPWTSS